VATQPARPSREALENQARRLLEHARRQSGASVEEMVKILGELQPRGAETRRSWYDWNEKPETVSLLTGLAAIQILGPEGTMELLFGSARDDEPGALPTGAAHRLSQLETALTDATADIATLQERVEGFVLPELAKQGELLSRLLADEDAGTASPGHVRGRRSQGRRKTADG
jgi:hypothetical protein